MGRAIKEGNGMRVKTKDGEERAGPGGGLGREVWLFYLGSPDPEMRSNILPWHGEEGGGVSENGGQLANRAEAASAVHTGTSSHWASSVRCPLKAKGARAAICHLLFSTGGGSIRAPAQWAVQALGSHGEGASATENGVGARGVLSHYGGSILDVLSPVGLL